MCPRALARVARRATPGAAAWRCPEYVLQAREEQRLVDSAVEDRDAHLHALRDYFPPSKSGLPRELGGRQVDCHRCSRLPCRMRVPKGIRPSGRSQLCLAKWRFQTGFGHVDETCRTPNALREALAERLDAERLRSRSGRRRGSACPPRGLGHRRTRSARRSRYASRPSAMASATMRAAPPETMAIVRTGSGPPREDQRVLAGRLAHAGRRARPAGCRAPRASLARRARGPSPRRTARGRRRRARRRAARCCRARDGRRAAGGRPRGSMSRPSSASSRPAMRRRERLRPPPQNRP